METYHTDLPVRADLVEHHKMGIAGFGQAGTWFTAETRRAVLLESRAAAQCNLCRARIAALSPYTEVGRHECVTDLADNIVEVVHRIKTDSGRLTERWFKGVIESGISQEEYVELVSLVATTLILDSFATGIGVELLPPPDLVAGEPTKVSNPEVIEGGAWVPLMKVTQEPTDLILPSSPNIFRAMGLVPSAVAHFFGVFRAHYLLRDLDFEINRSQTELIAARMSALNQCFY